MTLDVAIKDGITGPWHGPDRDYLRFQRALLRGGELDGSRILREATVDAAFTNQIGGSGAWAGLCNTHFWVDRSSGITGAIYSNFLPFAPPEALGLYQRTSGRCMREERRSDRRLPA